MGNDVEKILEERESSHGDYGKQAKLTEEIKDALLRAGYKKLPYAVRNALDLIATKMGRMVTGDFKHADHYDDIQGYARLAKIEVEKNRQFEIDFAAESLMK